MAKVVLLIGLLAPFLLMGQSDPCRCKKEDLTTVCHLSVKEYCYDIDGCNHTMDGTLMVNSLVRKLKNPANFGPNGKSSCLMEIKPLMKIKKAQDISDAGCDIFFVGSFNIDTSKMELNPDVTSVPDYVLNAIKSWSSLCHNNLVIVSQAEAKPWGYKVEDKNRNPNKKIAEPSKFSIFEGVFGSLSSFNQGGTYQGVITALPESGAEILAEDANNRPTVLLDVATSDLILGDIGILCGPAGLLSQSANVNPSNGNDKLAANLFALGCQIGQGTKFTESDLVKCPGQNLTLSSGLEINGVGIFVDSFITSQGCDSLHFFHVSENKPDTTLIEKTYCKGDTFNLEIDSIIFNESKQNGKVTLRNFYGCDSTIFINLKYNPTSTTQIVESVCSQSAYSIQVGQDVYSELNSKGMTILKNRFGCDSVIDVHITFIPIDTVAVNFIECSGTEINYLDKSYEAGSINHITLQAVTGCDSVVVLKIDTFAFPQIIVDTVIEIVQYETYRFSNQFSNDLTFKWKDTQGLDCLDCPNPSFNTESYPDHFFLEVEDEHECHFEYIIRPEYYCRPLVANVFSPASGNENAFITWNTICPVTDFSIKIYDRWADLIFQSNDINAAWNGTVNGVQLNAGVYPYELNYVTQGRKIISFGDVTILR